MIRFQKTFVQAVTQKQIILFGSLLLFLFLLGIQAYGADCQNATIMGMGLLRSQDTPAASDATVTLNGSESYEIILRVGTISYTALYQPKWKWSSTPKNLTVGGEVPVRIEGDRLFLNCGTQKQFAARIVDSRRPR